MITSVRQGNIYNSRRSILDCSRIELGFQDVYWPAVTNFRTKGSHLNSSSSGEPLSLMKSRSIIMSSASCICQWPYCSQQRRPTSDKCEVGFCSPS